MNALEFLQTALGGNMNFGTLKPLALEEIMEQYARHKSQETPQADVALNDLLCCPFCGEVPPLPNGDGTQYEIWCDCGMAMSTVQISDLMTIDERMESDDFMETHRYGEEYIERAKAEAVKNWNNRAI